MPSPVAHSVIPLTRRLLLRVTDPSLAVTDLPLAESRAIIGRSEDAHVVLDSQKVSRHHAELVKDPFQRWWVRDLGSRNGSKVNGQKITEAVFQPGDVLEIGGFTLALYSPALAPDESHSQSTLFVPTSDNAARISRLREYSTPRIAGAHLSALSEFGHQLNITQDAGERMRRLCRLMVEPQFHGQVAWVLRVRRDEPNRPHILSGPDLSAEWYQPLPRISQSVLRVLCESPEPVLATNASPAANQIELSISPDVMEMTVIATPIRFDESTVDLLYVVLSPQFGHGDWLALAALAVKQHEQAEAVWLNVGKIREYAAVARELELAQQIQLRLIPRDIRIAGLEIAIGFRPCHWVGGDYADVVPMFDNSVLLTIADVCGKGLPAALVTSSLHTLVHGDVRAGKSLNGMFHSLNEYLSEYLASGSFVTMVGLAMDPASGRFEYINAGHPPGIIVDAQGNSRVLPSGGSPPLGIAVKLESITGNVLAPGEMIALFTDGLTELVNDSESMLGMDGLAEQLRNIYREYSARPLAELAGRVTESLDRYEHGRMATDDRTFMLVRLAAS